MKQKIIKTADAELAMRMRESGFQELAREGSHFVFLNETNSKMKFSTEDKGKILFTNMLSF